MSPVLLFLEEINLFPCGEISVLFSVIAGPLSASTVPPLAADLPGKGLQ